MFENNSSTDLDDAEILEKFSNLLNKYQNQIEGGVNNTQHENSESIGLVGGDRSKQYTGTLRNGSASSVCYAIAH